MFFLSFAIYCFLLTIRQILTRTNLKEIQCTIKEDTCFGYFSRFFERSMVLRLIHDHKVCLMGHWCVRNLRILWLFLHSPPLSDVQSIIVDTFWNVFGTPRNSTMVFLLWEDLFEVDLSIEQKDWVVLLLLFTPLGFHFQKLSDMFTTYELPKTPSRVVITKFSLISRFHTT